MRYASYAVVAVKYFVIISWRGGDQGSAQFNYQFYIFLSCLSSSEMLTSTSTLIIDVFPLNHPLKLTWLYYPVQRGQPPPPTVTPVVVFLRMFPCQKIVVDPASFYCVLPIFHSNQRREVLYFSYFRPNIISLRSQDNTTDLCWSYRIEDWWEGEGWFVFSPVSVLVTVN